MRLLQSVLITLALWLLLVTVSLAQQAQPDIKTLRVTDADVALIGRALRELPYKDVAILLQQLQNQVDAQNEQRRLDQGKKDTDESWQEWGG